MKRVLLLLTIFFMIPLAASAQPNLGSAWNTFVTKTKIDLDGDGIPENVELKRVGTRDPELKDGVFKLFINGSAHSISSEWGSFSHSHGFYLADIQRSDRYKEIIIRMPSGSFTKDIVFWFDGKQVHRMASLNQPKYFRGDGTLISQEWYGFWWRTDTFILRSNRTLRRVPKSFYRVNRNTQTIQALPLYKRRTSQRPFVTLPVGRALTVEKTDLKGWFQIHSTGGSRGWVSEEELLSATSLMILP